MVHPNSQFRLCKWFTVEGLPGSGKSEFAEKLSAGTGLKNFGTADLWWEWNRLAMPEKVILCVV